MNQEEKKSEKQTQKDEFIVYRDQKKRYPWWVKSVDRITTETDDSRLIKPDHFKTAASKEKKSSTKREASREEIIRHVVKGIKENIPGRTLPDLALHYAAATYMHYTIGSLGDPRVNVLPGIGEIQNTWKLHPPQSLDLPAWKAAPEKASQIVEKAGIQLGAAMVGITMINPNWLNPGVMIDAGADQITSDGKNMLIPERMKYVICMLGVCPPDLPLAVDKPIDFGLQKFCAKCKKCATSCPANAISKADQPYWETVDPRQIPGKKTYFENNRACISWQAHKDVYCSTCMAVCPWSKQDKTLLHELAHITASKMPGLGKLLVKLDDLFGYGRITKGQDIDKWWDLKNPTRGVNSNQGRRI